MFDKDLRFKLVWIDTLVHNDCNTWDNSRKEVDTWGYTLTMNINNKELGLTNEFDLDKTFYYGVVDTKATDAAILPFELAVKQLNLYRDSMKGNELFTYFLEPTKASITDDVGQVIYNKAFLEYCFNLPSEMKEK